MTPTELSTALLAIKARVGLQADVFCSIDCKYLRQPVTLSVYAYGLTRGTTFRVEGSEFDEVLTAANAKWDEMQARFEGEKIESIALDIIRLTALHGVCTDAALRSDKYSDADLKQFGTRAVEKANEMAANGPFSIQAAEKANAA